MVQVLTGEKEAIKLKTILLSHYILQRRLRDMVENITKLIITILRSAHI